MPPILIAFLKPTEGRWTSEDHGHLDRKINRVGTVKLFGERWNQNEKDRLGREKGRNLPVN